MKVEHIKDIETFFKVVDECKGKVDPHDLTKNFLRGPC